MRQVVQLPLSHEEVFQGEAGQQIPYHRMYGKQYCVPALTVYSLSEVEELRIAAEAVDGIYCKVMRFIQQYMPDSFWSISWVYIRGLSQRHVWSW